MPHRLNEFRAKIQFITFAAMPSMIYRACTSTGTVSQTRYVQEAVCERLARDLDVPVENLLAKLPPPRGKAAYIPGTRREGPPRPVETVR